MRDILRDYERATHFSPTRSDVSEALQCPPWSRQPLDGTTVIVASVLFCDGGLQEVGGYGDIVMYLRYVPVLNARWPSCRVRFLCHPKLFPLLRHAHELGDVIEAGPDQPRLDAAYCTRLVDLPYLLDLPSFECIPPLSLRVPPGATVRVPPSRPGTIKAGIIWKGNPDHVKPQERSAPIGAVRTLFSTPGVTWYSLQFFLQPFEQQVLHECAVHDLAPALSGWVETASALKSLDVLVSVDTGPIYVAGELGVPTFAMYPGNVPGIFKATIPDTASVQSLYPSTMRMFTHDHLNDCWQRCASEVKVALGHFAKERSTDAQPGHHLSDGPQGVCNDDGRPARSGACVAG